MRERAYVKWRHASAGAVALGILLAIPFAAMPMPTKAARVSREGATASRQAAASTPPHIMLIVDENKDYQESNLPSGNNRYIIGNPEAPYLNQLADQYASATQEYSLFHPSFANYLAL